MVPWGFFLWGSFGIFYDRTSAKLCSSGSFMVVDMERMFARRSRLFLYNVFLFVVFFFFWKFDVLCIVRFYDCGKFSCYMRLEIYFIDGCNFSFDFRFYIKIMKIYNARLLHII